MSEEAQSKLSQFNEQFGRNLNNGFHYIFGASLGALNIAEVSSEHEFVVVSLFATAAYSFSDAITKSIAETSEGRYKTKMSFIGAALFSVGNSMIATDVVSEQYDGVYEKINQIIDQNLSAQKQNFDDGIVILDDGEAYTFS